MKITDIIRGVLDLVDRAEQPEQPAVVVSATVASPEQHEVDDSELVRMKQIAGLVTDRVGEYSNSPIEKYAGIDAVTAAGDDVHKSKHPSDIRSNSISMYPNFQAKE